MSHVPASFSMVVRQAGARSRCRLQRWWAMALLASGLLGCSDPYLSNSRKEEGGANSAANNAANAASNSATTDPSQTPWQWAEAQETIFAPWHIRLGDAQMQGASIADDRLTFAGGPPEALEGLRVNDLLWYQSETGAPGFLRRVVSFGDEGGAWLVRTTPAALDELFLKVALEAELPMESDGTLEGVPEVFKYNWCRVQADGPMAPCTEFPNLDEDGIYLSSEREPGSLDEPLAVAFEFKPNIQAAPTRLMARLAVDFFGTTDERCACLTQHFADTQALADVCELASTAEDVPGVVDDLKAQCHGRAKALEFALDGEFGLFLRSLHASSQTPGTDIAATLPLAWTSTMVGAAGDGTIGLEMHVTAQWQMQSERTFEASWRPTRGPGVKWSGTWAMQWPDSAGNPTVRASAEGLAKAETEAIATSPVYNSSGDGRLALDVALVGRVVLMGVPVAQVHMVEQKVENTLRVAPIDAPAEDGFPAGSCIADAHCGATSAIVFEGPSPLRTQSLSPMRHALEDTCADLTSGVFAELAACIKSSVDYCSDN